jgi:hypothetical protein
MIVKRIIFKYWITPLVFFQIYMIYLLFDSVNNKLAKTDKINNLKKDKEFNEINFKRRQEEPREKEYHLDEGNSQTLTNNIWEQLDESLFFKRTSAFFVIEQSLLKINYIRNKNKAECNLDFRIEIKVSSKEVHHIYVNNALIKRYNSAGSYEWNSLSYKFDLLKLLKKDSYNDILNKNYKFHLYIVNSNNTLEETLYPIDVNLKYIRSRPGQQKEGSIVCSKCFWLKQEDYKDLFWWIELHRQAGYEKVIFCNNSIPNTKEFNDLFERNKDFVELSQLNFIPNFINNPQNSTLHNYLNFYDQLGPNFAIDSDIFNMMITNECFLNNTDKYLHVAVVDPDEIIIPIENKQVLTLKDNFDLISQLNLVSNSNIPTKLTNLETSCSNDLNAKLEEYLNTINTKSSTFHFHMGFYLDNNQVRQIFEGIESYYQEGKDLSQPHNITIIDLIPQSKDHSSYISYNFTLTVKNKDEINYALNLCKIYRNLIQVFEKSHDKYLSKYSNRFHRFFYIGGLLSSFASGKLFHNTDVTFDLSVHYPNPDKNYPDQAQLYWVGYNQGHVSHFRHNNELYKSSQTVISITELILDFNYLNCFYKPIVKKYFDIKSV